MFATAPMRDSLPIRWRMLLLTMLVSALALAASAPARADEGGSPRLPAGSTIGGVEVGGLAREEAIDHIAELWANYAQVEWHLEIAGEVVDVRPAELGLAPDLTTLAAQLAQAAPAPEGFWERARSLFVRPAPVHLELALEVDDDAYLDWVAKMKTYVEVPPRDARIDWKERTVLPEQVGYVVDHEAWRTALSDSVSGMASRTLRLALKEVVPAVRAQDLANVDFSAPFASFPTKFNVGIVNRSSNIAVASSVWQGYVIEPHATVSFNQVVGPRTVAAGYKLAPVYTGRRVDSGIGGGICQVSTTLYNAALLAGMEILKRGGHSRPCAYAPPGRDATVSWGSRDFVFKNPYDFPLYVETKVEGGEVTFSFFGDLTHKPNITLTEEVVWTGGPGDPIRILDETLKPGTEQVIDEGFTGRKITVTRIWNAGTPSEKREVISVDKIGALKGIVHYNPWGDAMQPVAPEPVEDEEEEGAFF